MPKTPTPYEGFAERISSVLEARDMSIRALQQAMEESGADNSGYSSVFRYVKGEFPPSVAWVEDAARILEVTPASLAFGDSPTQREGPKAFFLNSSIMRDDPPSAAAIRTAAGGMTGMTAGAYFVGEDLMLAIVYALARAQPDDAPEPTEKEMAGLASRLSFAVQGILGAVRPEAPGCVTAGATLGVLAAILAYVPPGGEGRRLTEVTSYLPTPPRRRPDA